MGAHSKPKTKSREVVMTRAGVVSAVGFALALLALFGIDVPEEMRDRLVDVMVLGMPLALPLGAALWARLKVTPSFDPRDRSGRALVPSDDA